MHCMQLDRHSLLVKALKKLDVHFAVMLDLQEMSNMSLVTPVKGSQFCDFVTP